MKDKIKGGLSDGMNISDIAKKHGIKLSSIITEYAKGIKIESEHSSDKSVAKEITRDHLFEDPKYYSKLESLKL